MITFLQKNDGAIVLLAPILLALGSIGLAFSGGLFEPDYSDAVLLNRLLHLNDVFHNIWINLVLTVSMVLAAAVTLNRGVHQFGLIGSLNNIPLWVVVILFFTIPEDANHFLLWSCLYLMILFLRSTMNILDDKRINTSVFNASIAGGLIAVILPYFYPLFLTIIGVLVLTRNLNLRRFFLALLGMLLPVYISVLILYIAAPSNYLLPIQQGLALFDFNEFYWTWNLISYLAVSILGLILATIFSKASTLRERRKWRFEVLFLLTTSAALFYHGDTAMVAATVIPSSIILSRGLSLCDNIWLKRLLFYAMIVAALINLWNP